MKRILVIETGTAPLGPCHDAGPVGAALRRRGHQVFRLLLHRPGQSAESGPTGDESLAVISWLNRFSWSACQEIRYHIRRFRPDEIHVWGLQAGLLSTVLTNLVRCPVKQFVASVAQSARGTGKWPSAGRLAGRVVKVVRHARLRDGLDTRPARQTRVLPWFDYQRPADLALGNQLRSQLAIPRDAKLAGTVAPLMPRTRIKDFLWAGDLLRCVRDDVHWLVMGTGPGRWRLQRYASQLDMGGRIHFIDSPVGGLASIAALDIYVQPSDWLDDYCGLRAAISFAIPCIGISQTVHEELVTHHRTGYLVERGARNEIARCVNRLVSEPDIADQMSQQLRATRPPALVSVDQAIDDLGESWSPPAARAG